MVLNVKLFANVLVSVVNIGTSSVEGGAVAGGKRNGGFDSLINGLQVGLGFLNGAEGVAAEMSVHIEGGDEAVIDDFPLGSVQGLSIDGRVHNLNH